MVFEPSCTKVMIDGQLLMNKPEFGCQEITLLFFRDKFHNEFMAQLWYKDSFPQQPEEANNLDDKWDWKEINSLAVN